MKENKNDFNQINNVTNQSSDLSYNNINNNIKCRRNTLFKDESNKYENYGIEEVS